MDMVERVARAIWSLNEDTDCYEYDQLMPHAKERADACARAAIEAMREPTDEQRNNYYELSHRTATFFDAYWERAIDAILMKA